jgi:hypothetical protein
MPMAAVELQTKHLMDRPPTPTAICNSCRFQANREARRFPQLAEMAGAGGKASVPLTRATLSVTPTAE